MEKEGELMIEIQNVLFLCTNNSSRSQMAEGLLRSLYYDKYSSFSAGLNATSVHPLAIKVMDEIGINIKEQHSKDIEELKGMQFDYIVTVCDNVKEHCPFFPGKITIHQNFNDPDLTNGSDEEKLNEFRKIRDEIKEWIIDFFS
jgi:arsenate reductase